MSNLVATLRGNFSEELVGRLVPYLGIDSGIVLAVIESGIDALAANSSETGGLEARAGLGSTDEFDRQWRAEGGLIGLASQGAAVLDALVGDRKQDIAAQVAATSGVNHEVAEKALCIISAAMNLSSPSAPESSIEVPKVAQKKRITVGNLDDVQEAVVATVDAPAPAPLNFPVAEPASTKSPSKVTETTAIPAPSQPAKNRMPALAALFVIAVLSAIGLMKGCGSLPADSQPSQLNQSPASADAKLEDPAFPVNPDVNAVQK